MKIVPLTLSDVEQTAFALAKELMTWQEPIPPFETRFPDKLESSLMVPFQTFQAKSLYPTISKKAAILFYLLIKNHPFQNGNKRLAVACLLVFLGKNGKWLKVLHQGMYRVAKFVAESDPILKKPVIDYIEEFIEKYLEASS